MNTVEFSFGVPAFVFNPWSLGWHVYGPENGYNFSMSSIKGSIPGRDSYIRQVSLH